MKCENFDFTDKVVWLTGAGSGIGLETAEKLINSGARLIAIDRYFSQPLLGATKCVELDLTDWHKVSTIVKEITNDYPKIDALIHGAGILVSGGVFELSFSNWQQCLDTNVTAVFHLSQQLAPLFKKQGSGAIVTVASNAAHVPRLNMLAYCTAKAAVVALTKCLALELAAYNIRCNLVSPGSTDTAMLNAMFPAGVDYKSQLIAGFPSGYKLGIPLSKIATTAEIANTILFLASDLASHITMQDIVVDGGATLGA